MRRIVCQWLPPQAYEPSRIEFGTAANASSVATITTGTVRSCPKSSGRCPQQAAFAERRIVAIDERGPIEAMEVRRLGEKGHGHC